MMNRIPFIKLLVLASCALGCNHSSNTIESTTADGVTRTYTQTVTNTGLGTVVKEATYETRPVEKAKRKKK
ncbi:hypothetical protein [Borrelia turcica]|nr:hypothetical protein [Borrelia turcica]